MEPDIQELKRLHAAAEVGVGTQRDIAVAMNAAYRHLPQLIARLEAAEAAMQWRPIEEAPKDGTEIMTWVGGVAQPFVYLCRWSDSYSIHGLGGNWTDGLCNMGIEVTHYMPLPAPPEAAR